MTPKQSKMFLEMHATVTQTSKDVDFLLNRIRVNGSEGMQNILTDNHVKREKIQSSVDELAKRTDFLQKITAKTASSYALWEASKKWAEQRRWVAAIFKVMFNKIMFRITLFIIVLSAAMLFGDRASSLFWKIFHLIK